MRIAILSLVLALSPLVAAADRSAPDADRELRVRVALALAATDAAPAPVPAPAVSDDGCGVCSPDLDAARATALKTGKPIVLFVGGCHGVGRELAKDGASLVHAPSYDRDDIAPADTPRIVVIERRGDGLAVRETLPAGTGAATLRTRITAAALKVGATVPAADGCGTIRLADGRLVQVCPGK